MILINDCLMQKIEKFTLLPSLLEIDNKIINESNELKIIILNFIKLFVILGA